MLKRYQLNPAPICGDFCKPRRLGPGKRLSDPRQTIGLFVGRCPRADLAGDAGNWLSWVVGEDVEANLGSDVGQSSRSEVVSPHPVLNRAEDVLDNAPPDPHGVGHSSSRRCILTPPIRYLIELIDKS